MASGYRCIINNYNFKYDESRQPKEEFKITERTNRCNNFKIRIPGII